METVRILLLEGVISIEILYQQERLRGLFNNDSLRALFNTVSEDPCQLKVFSTVLLQSEYTVHFSKINILKEYIR